MAEFSFDQNAWLKRIGYSGPLEPTLSTLHQLIFAHSHAIAYESLDIMLGRTPRLDLESLQTQDDIGQARWLLLGTKHVVPRGLAVTRLQNNQLVRQGRARHGDRRPTSGHPYVAAA
jgi:hypothetical protein